MHAYSTTFKLCVKSAVYKPGAKHLNTALSWVRFFTAMDWIKTNPNPKAGITLLQTVHVKGSEYRVVSVE